MTVKQQVEGLGFALTNVEECEDRIWFDDTPAFRLRLEYLTKAGALASWPRILTTPTHGESSVCSYRQTCWRDSVQLVVHDNGRVEADVDDFNPDQGVLPAAIHLGQVIYGSIKKLFHRKK